MAKFGPFNYERILGQRDYTLQAQLDDIVKATDERITAVVREATQEVIEQAQTVGPSSKAVNRSIAKGIGKTGRGKKRKDLAGPITSKGTGDKGGKMRVDTGFLRASGRVSLSGMPSGPTRGEPDQTYTWEKTDAELTLAGVKAGDTIYFGWTANYAKVREAYDGFLISAVQNWQSIVAKITVELRERIK